jgi:hypothetical protein
MLPGADPEFRMDRFSEYQLKTGSEHAQHTKPAVEPAVNRVVVEAGGTAQIGTTIEPRAAAKAFTMR